MKNTIIYIIPAFCLSMLQPLSCGTQKEVALQDTISVSQGQWRPVPPTPPQNRLIVAYLTSWTNAMPDPEYLTHVNYGFGHVNPTYDGIIIEEPLRLRQMTLMKIKYPNLKILLSIGGWQGSNGFSEMSSFPETRERFAADCQRVVTAYRLDGIDLDWEYPTIATKTVSASPYDVENFTLLIRAVRAAIGTNKLLTTTSIANAKCINFPEIIDYVDFVNVMSYDMGLPPYHHASLYRSEISGITTVDESIQEHLAAGLPPNKMVLGMSFYGKGSERIPRYVLLGNVKQLEGYHVKWDPVGKTPFLADQNDRLLFGYENPLSLSYKIKYAVTRNLLGAMVWEYAGDSEQKYLVQTIHKFLKETSKK